MTGFEVKQSPGNIGRMAVIGYQGKQYLANVLDQVAGTTKPKRVRIQFDPNLQGNVLMRGQYEFVEWKDEYDD